MHELRTQIEIEATPVQVWSILLDFPSYTDWNPFVRSLKGIARGAAAPAVLTVVFDGERYFQIDELAARRVRFIQGEKFSGVLVPFVKSNLDGGTKAGFIAVNQTLKSRADSALVQEA